MNIGTKNHRIHYIGPANNKLLVGMPAGLEESFPNHESAERGRIFEVAVELAQNSWRHSPRPIRSEMIIDFDEKGAYVEVASRGTKADKDRILENVNRLRGIPQDELLAVERSHVANSIAENLGGLGLIQVFKRAKWSDEGRMVECIVQPADDVYDIRIRAYVA